MKTITIHISETEKSYPIYIGKNLIEKLPKLCKLKNYTNVFVITDENVAPHFLQKVLTVIPNKKDSIIIKPGEKEKHIETVQRIWLAMKTALCDRKSLVINLGGGVIGDMGGFAASTYMRGVDFINIPTTLLAQIDESVGGKTGFDFAGIKNSIGTFSQPAGVIIDVDTLRTLPTREFLSGFAEIIKHGLIADKKYFEKVSNKKPQEFTNEELIEIIEASCEIKSHYVTTDTKEQKGLRKILNFGHTIGHAIESLALETDKPLLHGEAVSIGIIAEVKISELQGTISSREFQTIQKAFVNAELPISISNMPKEKILNTMKYDKKNVNGVINFTLLNGIGDATYDNQISDETIHKALNSILK